MTPPETDSSRSADGPQPQETFARLDALVNWERRSRRAAARFSLDPMRDLLERLRSPQLAIDTAVRAVHVAGSKGKGSVAALIARGAEAGGLRVGRYGSPHVETLTERVEICGRNVEERVLATALEDVMAARAAAVSDGSPAHDATWFDVVTAAALCVFRDARLDLWVLECGLGGRLDSTNAVDCGTAVITSIELEHTEVLGMTRNLIAGEKAGIVKPSERGAMTLVCGVPRRGSDGEPDTAWLTIAGRARAVGARIAPVAGVETEASWETFSIDERNRRLARATLGVLGERGVRDRKGTSLGPELLTEDVCRLARLPGRLERFSWGDSRIPVVLDGAHTPRSVDLALRSLAAPGSDSDLEGLPTVVLALGKDKDLRGILKTLAGRADQLICTSVGSELFRSPDEIAAVAGELGWVTKTASSPRAALEQAFARNPPGSWILILGSLYLAGEVRPLLTPHP